MRAAGLRGTSRGRAFVITQGRRVAVRPPDRLVGRDPTTPSAGPIRDDQTRISRDLPKPRQSAPAVAGSTRVQSVHHGLLAGNLL